MLVLVLVLVLVLLLVLVLVLLLVLVLNRLEFRFSNMLALGFANPVAELPSARVPWPGDLDGDGIVDGADLACG